MRWIRLTLTMALTLGAVGLVHTTFVPLAAACSCVLLDTAEQAESAHLVASGTVTAVSEPRPDGENGPVAVYSVDLDRIWKGQAQASIDVLSPRDGASCGIEGIEAGSAIILFAGHADILGAPSTSWRTNLCNGTGPSDSQRIDELTALLGTPSTPEPDSASPAEAVPEAGDVRMLGALGLVAFAALAAGAYAWRRRRP